MLEKLKSAETSGHVYFSATILDMLRKKALDEITQMYASECVGIQEWRESSGAGSIAP